ncbi:MAG: isoprenylcysteine carboxylmethyltransferase family protein [Candidatus Anaerobiospirillum pullicola]|uniref:Isoprenylcysteine carboxylmethyltransferase family protein n=1 Tax=Candidatus Anaerobiospirillum pullicola TaxID=2838451 RepID=A0A948TG45_9GAMM|nr:isoprenylcysteine carboxylmethyltransferase family protein [Candidatus Anaerobiospirillum pullicola]
MAKRPQQTLPTTPQQTQSAVHFSLREKVIYALGFIGFIIGGPAVMAYLAAWIPGTFLAEQPSTFYLGGVASAIGLFFALWANYELVIKGRGGAGNFGKIKLMTETKHLVTTGPYSICRNPMHLGVFLYYMGFACALNSLISLVIPLAVICVAYIIAIFIDEPRLERDFPDEYALYKSQVPRFLPKALVWRRK